LSEAPKHDLIIHAVRDENARAMRLLTGETDIVANGFSSNLLDSLPPNEVQFFRAPTATTTYIVFQTETGPFADPGLRKAVAEAIDKPALNRDFWGNYSAVANTMIPPLSWAHTPMPAPSVLNQDQAKATIIRLANETGNRLPIRIRWLSSTDRSRSNVARMIKQQFKALGLDIVIEQMDFGTLIVRMNSGQFDAAILQMTEFTEPNMLKHFLHSRFIPPNGANRGRVRAEDLDNLLDLGETESDPLKRRSLYSQVERMVRERSYFVPLVHEDSVFATSMRVNALQPSSDGRWLFLANLP
jgi:ABC-type transport system substrate-binding protein